MADVSTDWSTLCALVFLLGVRHGFDADHLAAIDGLTRLSSRRQHAFARYCGALFSLGHGAVVIVIAATVGLLSERWAPPDWLDAFGAALSIAFLLFIGIVNLRAALATAPGSVVPLVGIRAAVFARLLPAHGPLGVAAVGALFAVSFDTISQATLFAVTAARFGGVGHALGLGALFVLGMLVSGGANGWWIARLIARADQIAALASRIISVAVAAVSLVIAGFGVARLLSPAVAGWNEGRQAVMGGVVVLVIATSFVVARVLAGRLDSRRQAPVRLAASESA
jgi:high-affinity nickel-transport protein